MNDYRDKSLNTRTSAKKENRGEKSIRERRINMKT